MAKMVKQMNNYLNSLKQQLASSSPVIGAWLTSDSPIVTEAMASMGFQFLVVDMEHGAADVSRAETLFAIAGSCGAAPLARLGSADEHLARRLLDLGAHGLIVSTVEDAAEFENFTKYCYYPPNGRRGVGLSRCNLFGDKFEVYLKGFKPVILPMIETARGVAAAASIAALPTVDALFLGPYDLSTDLGCPGDFEAARFREAIEKVKSACSDSGKVIGIHQVETNLTTLRSRLSEGFGFIAYGTDILALRHALKGASDLAKKNK
jgi:2-dehydro-3-deoxyglucarate aldolase